MWENSRLFLNQCAFFLSSTPYRISDPNPSSSTLSEPNLSSSQRANSSACRRITTAAEAAALAVVAMLAVVAAPVLTTLSTSEGEPNGVVGCSSPVVCCWGGGTGRPCAWLLWSILSVPSVAAVGPTHTNNKPHRRRLTTIIPPLSWIVTALGVGSE